MTELIPLRGYYHRHSKSIFWGIKEIVPFGNNALFRWLLGWLCPPKIAFLKVEFYEIASICTRLLVFVQATTPAILRKLYDRKHVLQDMLVPMDKFIHTLEVFDREVEVCTAYFTSFLYMNTNSNIKFSNTQSRARLEEGRVELVLLQLIIH